MTIHQFRVRWYQQRFHHALVNRTHDRLIAIWHRRAGKDEIVLNAMREIAWKEPGTYWHCFPEQKQARKAIWNGVNGHTGKRRIFEAFPPPIIARMQDDDMFIELTNGATFQLIGSDRYDATVGAGPKGIAYSEWALSNPAAWAYHSPMIRETKGFAAFITTPRGNNHAKKMFDSARNTPDVWFSELLSIEQTQALSQRDLDEALKEYQEPFGDELGLALYEQEYECSFQGAMVGAYWGGEMARAERDGRIGVLPIDWTEPVHTAWDLGKAVNNPIWCFQVIRGRPHIVDFYRPDSDDLEEWCRWLDERGYHGTDYVPHDIMHTSWGVKRTRLDMLKGMGRNPKMVPMVSVAEGITAGRETIKQAFFDEGRCGDGIEGLKSYRREWDDERKTFRDNPVKDWAEHIGSSFRYLGLSWRDAAPVYQPPPPKKGLVYEAAKDGSINANLGVRDAIDAMVRKRTGRSAFKRGE